MKHIKKSLITLLLLTGFVFFLSGCYEPQYYHTYHHHSRGWYDHRHRPYPPGVNFEIDVYSRHRHH